MKSPKNCINCKYYVSGTGQCYGQKYAPRVDINDSCENFKADLTGKWINREAVSNTTFPFWERYECNQCHKFSGYSNFCPNCGAKMKTEGAS